jgi:hypothetical protein
MEGGSRQEGKTASGLLGCLLGSLALLAAGLGDSGYVDRQLVDPGFPQYLSAVADARGWPFAWWIAGPPELVGSRGVLERILWADLLLSWLVALVLVVIVWRLFLRVRRSRRSKA